MHLVKYEAARAALAEARAVDEVKDIRDKALALAAYARQAKDTGMMQDAAEIKVRAERKLGEMIREQKETVGLQAGSRGIGKKVEFQEGTPLPTLADAGIDKKLSMRSQQLAAMPAEHFEAAIATSRATAEAVTTTHMLRLAQEVQRNREMRDELDALRKRNFWRYVRDSLTQARRYLHQAEQDDAPQCHPEIAADIRDELAVINKAIDTHLGERA